MRALTPEILDFLAPDDPRAMRSRRDLARINAVMRQSAIMAKALIACAPPKKLADLGGGDGRFMLSMARRLAKHWPGVQVSILDRQSIVSEKTQAGFAALGWRCETLQGDLFETLPRIQPDIVTANLFLHHFDDAALRRLLALIASRSRTFVACEPRRSAFALLGARLVFALGANGVTRHDAVASVRGGFRDLELSMLWPKDRAWICREHSVFPFSQVFWAHARSGAEGQKNAL
ncbi:MAG TPA: methyltransferase [Rhizomicrobium sp.]|nr:methyltransferase [Rhizomicrobium sp.]